MHLSTSDTFSKTDNLGPPVSGFPGDKPPLGGAEQAGTLEETVLFPTLAAPIHIPPTVHEGSFSSTFSPLSVFLVFFSFLVF